MRKDVGLSENYIGRIERGEALFSTKLLDKICTISGKSPDFILYGKDSTKALSVRRTIDTYLERSSKEELDAYLKFISIIKSKFTPK